MKKQEILERKTNHSARRTAITTSVHAGVQPNVVQQLSGHKNIQCVNIYSSASTEQQKNKSSVITNFTNQSSGHNNEENKAADNNESGSKRDSQEIVGSVLNKIAAYENLQLENL